jgi:glycosyltransferase involved in cell wall biosynthesis
MSALRQPLDSALAPPGTPLRVAFFSDAFPERNGTGAYYHDLLPQLAPRVEALEVFQPGAGVAAPRVSIPMPGDPGQRLVAPPIRHIRQRCDALRPHIVVAVTPGLYGLLGAWEARRHGAVLISAFHTDFEQLARMYWPNPIFRSAVNLVVGTANRILCRRSRCVLINNADLESQVRRLGARDIDVIGTPLSREFLDTSPPPIPENLRRVCFAGRLAPEKNVEQIIRAARSLPQLEFVICGEGPLRSALEAQASGIANIRFTGWLDRARWSRPSTIPACYCFRQASKLSAPLLWKPWPAAGLPWCLPRPASTAGQRCDPGCSPCCDLKRLPGSSRLSSK